MSIYSGARAKITITTVFICLSIIVGMWLLLFVTDYIMYKNNMPLLFSNTRIEEINNKRITVESGLGYYAIMDENNVTQFYLFGNKIK